MLCTIWSHKIVIHHPLYIAMKMCRFASALALVALAVLSIGQSTASAQDASDVFERLRAKYATIESLQAEFTQTMTSAYSDEAATSAGTLILSGDKYRIETGSQTLVTDGITTYIYLPNEKQVLINNFVEDETSFTPSDFLLNYDERFDVAKVDAVQHEGSRHFKLLLKPKSKDSFFREATLWMRDSDNIITRLEVLDVNETRMVFSLNNVKLNPKLSATTFTFMTPAGAEEIDLR